MNINTGSSYNDEFQMVNRINNRLDDFFLKVTISNMRIMISNYYIIMSRISLKNI